MFILRETMGIASGSLVLFIVFCFIPTGILSQGSTAPIVSLEGLTTYAVLNRQKVISCTVTDSTGTAVTVTWQKNSVNLINSFISGYTWNSSPVNNHADLTIQNVQQGDEAIFTCIAQNGLRGKSEFSTEMILIGTPSISLRIADGVSQVAVGRTTILQCNINGTENTLANTNINWQGPSGVTLPAAVLRTSTGSRTSELTLISLTSSYSGSYNCSATNVAGIVFSNTVALIVIEAPIVTIPDISTYAITGQSKSIECQVSGTSISSVTWSRNGGSLAVGSKYYWTYSGFSGRADLTVYSLTKADAGTYKCFAQNTVGFSAEDSIDLSVEDILSVTIGSVTDGILGQSKTIPCSIFGTPINTVQWLFNGNQLSKGSQYSWNTGAIADLYISSVTLANSGTYICKATNQASTQQASVSLAVISPPTVTILSSKPTFGIVGQSKTIFCQVSGTVVSTVTWYFNGTPLTISSQYSWTQSLISGRVDLVISSLLKSGSGTYNCSARNDAGTVSDSVVLSAEEILDVTVTNSRETGNVGQVKTLSCTITGTPITSIQWFFNGNTLANNGLKYYWPTSSTPNLQINSLTIADAGVYTCSASNQAGTDYASITFTVIVRPVVNIESSTDLSANEGENVLITCIITNTTTIDTLQWYFQDRFLYHSDPHYYWPSISTVSIPFDGTLRIYSVTSQDTGTYKCQATNAAGTGEDAIGLFVLARPTVVITGPSSLTAYVGQALRIPCTASGSTSITFVQWYYNSVSLSNNGVRYSWNNRPASGNGAIIIHDGTLTVSSVQIGDGGTYECRAGNTAGTRNASVQVTVYALPKVMMTKTSESIYSSRARLVIGCSVSGYQITSVQWFFNNAQLGNFGRYSWTTQTGTFSDSQPLPADLTVNNIIESDAGTYICNATNPGGWTIGTYVLSVDGIPTVNAPITSYTANEGSLIPVNMTCFIAGFNTTQQWIFNGSSITSIGVYRVSFTNSILTLSISPIRLSQAGTYQCSAANGAGQAVSSPITLSVVAIPVVSITSTKPVTANEDQTSITIGCSVTGTGLTAVKWYFNGNKELNRTNSHYSWSYSNSPSLTIYNVVEIDAGNYSCFAENQAGSHSDSVTLNISLKPRVSTTGSIVTVLEHTSAVLFCTVNSTQTFTTVWRFNGFTLTTGGRFDWTSGTTKADLSILVAQPSDSGTYTCVATNSAGSRQVQVALTAQVRAPIITIPQTQYAVEERQSVTLQCDIEASEIDTVTWLANGVTLTSVFGGHFYFQTSYPSSWNTMSQYLKISNVQKTDEGIAKYQCSATNIAGRVTSNSAISLDVQYGPVVTVFPSQQVVLLGEIVTLQCTAQSNPITQSISWTKDSDTTVLSTQSTLRIGPIQASDAGTYRCTANNVLTVPGTGNKERSGSNTVILTTVAPPQSVFLVSSNMETVVMGNSVTLTCNSMGGTVPFYYYWQFSGQNVSQSRSYTIQNIAIIQAGNYDCWAWNSYGKRKADQPVTVVVNLNTGASTSNTCGVGWELILGLTLGILFFLLVLILIIVCCCYFGCCACCKKKESKTKITPGEKPLANPYAGSLTSAVTRKDIDVSINGYRQDRYLVPRYRHLPASSLASGSIMEDRYITPRYHLKPASSVASGPIIIPFEDENSVYSYMPEDHPIKTPRQLPPLQTYTEVLEAPGKHSKKKKKRRHHHYEQNSLPPPSNKSQEQEIEEDIVVIPGPSRDEFYA
ncbi:hypothetical protein CHS0354_019165 [Potamilus streckersoni]|uniref:Ig-like domain-containing protein n=1 Tax=Potamilus streckersoni TaxID=2493646 RepID=A0AAE0T040_9BIVA|nr:hypothetical protein CHS0354_019165 [Potamilus streckersoni]